MYIYIGIIYNSLYYYTLWVYLYNSIYYLKTQQPHKHAVAICNNFTNSITRVMVNL